MNASSGPSSNSATVALALTLRMKGSRRPTTRVALTSYSSGGATPVGGRKVTRVMPPTESAISVIVGTMFRIPTDSVGLRQSGLDWI